MAVALTFHKSQLRAKGQRLIEPPKMCLFLQGLDSAPGTSKRPHSLLCGATGYPKMCTLPQYQEQQTQPQNMACLRANLGQL